MMLLDLEFVLVFLSILCQLSEPHLTTEVSLALQCKSIAVDTSDSLPYQLIDLDSDHLVDIKSSTHLTAPELNLLNCLGEFYSTQFDGLE